MEEIREDEINILEIWHILWKNKIFIFIFTFSLILITMIISLLMPKSYKSEAKITPSLPSETSTLRSIASSLGLQTTSKITGVDLCYSILKSRTILDRIIDKFNLVEVYRVKTKEDAREKLSGLTDIRKTKEGTIEISVIDFSPERARDIANSYIIFLDEIIRSLNITSASQKRLFIEKRLKETEEELRNIEEKLKNYQISKKISVGRDIVETAQTAGEIQGKYLAKKIELETMKKILNW